MYLSSDEVNPNFLPKTSELAKALARKEVPLFDKKEGGNIPLVLETLKNKNLTFDFQREIAEKNLPLSEILINIIVENAFDLEKSFQDILLLYIEKNQSIKLN